MADAASGAAKGMVAFRSFSSGFAALIAVAIGHHRRVPFLRRQGDDTAENG